MDKLLLVEAYPTVAKNFSNPNVQKEFRALVKDYMDRNRNSMTAIAPIKQIFFTNTEKDKIFELAGLEPNKLKDIMKRSKDIKSDAMVVNPFTLVMSLITRYCIKERKGDLLKVVEITFAFSFYPSLFSKYFKYEPNEHIMAYAINNMSAKYRIKTAGLFNTIADVSELCLNTHKSRLAIGSDKDHVNYILDLKTRLNNIFKNIYRAFKEAHDSGHILYTQSDDFDDDNYRETENTNIVGDRISKAALMKVTQSGVDYRLVTYAAKISQVSVNELKNYMTNIIDNSNELGMLIDSIVFAYINDGYKTDTIHSTNFLINCLQIYKRSNSTDPNIINMKSVLDDLIKKYTSVLTKTSRQATINNFRRALFIYFVLVIQSVG